MRSILLKSFLFVLAALFTSAIFSQNTAPNPMEQVGENVTISGTIYSGKFLVNVKTKPTFLNLYDSSANHRLMIRIDSGDRGKFSIPPEEQYLNKDLSITGKVENYKGTP